MPLFFLKDDVELITNSTLTGGARVMSGEIGLKPDDLSPNRNWREVAEDGTPRAWGINLPVGREFNQVYASKVGNPPLAETLSRQTFPGVVPGSSWSAFDSLAFGWFPNRDPDEKSRLPRPGSPVAQSVPVARKGLPGGAYGVRLDLRGGRGRTLPSEFATVTLVTGNGIRVFVDPQWLARGATHAGVYVTRPGSGGLAGTEREQGVADLALAMANGYFDIVGPYDDNGRRPATKDESGYGRMAEPLFRRRHGRVFVDRRPARFDLQPGLYRFGYQAFPDSGGATPVSLVTARVRVDAKEKNTAFWFFWPGLPKGWHWVPWVLFEPLTQGPPVWSRAYAGRSIRGAEDTFGEDKARDGIPFYGYSSDAEPGGIRFRTTASEPPTEDTTGLLGEDTLEAPAVSPASPGLPDPGDYLIGTTDEDELGNETLLSLTTKLTLAAGNTMRVIPSPVTNQLRNPQGAERGADGTVYDWSNANTTGATSTSKFEDGSLILTGTATGTSLEPISDLLPLTNFSGDAATQFAIRARLRLTRVTGGAATQLILRYFDDTATNASATVGQVGTDVVLLQMAATGKLELPARGQIFGPGGTAIPDGATQIRLIARGWNVATSNNTNWNSLAYFENLAIFFAPSAVRNFESLGAGEPVSFAPSAGRAYPQSSYAALGPVPQAEDAPASTELPEEILDFEGGAWDVDWTAAPGNSTGSTVESVEGIPTAYATSTSYVVGDRRLALNGYIYQVTAKSGTGTSAASNLTASWTTTPMATVVDNAGANQLTWQNRGRPANLYGTYGLRLEDQTTNAIKQNLKRRDMGNANTKRSFRWPDEMWQLPTKGELLRFRFLDASGVVLFSGWYTPTGFKVYRHKANGDKDTSTVVLSGLTNGVKVEHEMSVTNGGTTSGTFVHAAGLNGNPRTTLYTLTGQSLTGRVPRILEWGFRESDAGAKFIIHTDDGLVTPSGAPLNYEAPPAPSGTTVPASAPPPDAPLQFGSTTAWRLYDSASTALNQWAWFIEPGVERAPGEDFGGYCEDILTVIPGEVITHAVNGRWDMWETSEDASHQFFVTLYGPDVPPLQVGSPFGPGKDSATVSRSGGARMNLAAGMASSSDWDDDDFYQSFTIPSGYYWATIGPKNGLGGFYVWQEHLFHPDTAAITTQAGRDALRSYGRATSGTATLVIEAVGERSPYGGPLHSGRLALGLVQASLAEGASISGITYQSGPTDVGPWSTAQTDPTLVPENSYYKISWSMTGLSGADGATPSIPKESAYVLLAPFEAMLLKADRTELPGGTLVTGHDSPDLRPRGEPIEIGGDVLDPARSKTVSYLTKPLTIHVETEEAKRYLESLSADDELCIENPDLGGTGLVQTIRPGVKPVVVTTGGSAFVSNGKRNVYGTCELPNAQVIEEAPLVSP